MEALTISAANLETIERNLGSVANELSGVIANVSSVNKQVNSVEAKVASLNNEIQNLVKEIRETTIITNARQTIMYNSSVIEKKFGYYDLVRRKVESLIEVINNSDIDTGVLNSLRQEILLNNPNYWLANALASLIAWILDDKDGTYKELNNALKKDSKKTSLFFALINLKLGRFQPAQNWINKYLSYQDPMHIDKDFIAVLDLATIGEFGQDGKQAVLDKINEWFTRLNINQEVHDRQIRIFTDFINSEEESLITMPMLDSRTPDINVLKNNLTITSSYLNVYNKLQNIMQQEKNNKSIDDVLKDLIYEYEDQEQTYQKENFKNNLIISCNGNREEAMKLYEKQEYLYDKDVDFITLLSNIVIYKESFNVSVETQKIALAFVTKYLVEAYENKNKQINFEPFLLTIQGFKTTTKDGTNMDSIRLELDNYLHNLYDRDDKDLIIILIVLNILSIIGLFITMNSKILSILLIIILVLGNIFLFSLLHKRKKSRDNSLNVNKNLITLELERVLAEAMDYHNILQNDLEYYNKLINFLNSLKVLDYINYKERNLKIGE